MGDMFKDKFIVGSIVVTIIALVGGAFFLTNKPPKTSEVPQITEKVTVSESDRSIGPNDAPLTLVEYSDFQCPACATYYPLINQIKKEYEGKLRLVFRHFPLPMHPHAPIASRAAEAANRQGKFWEMHDKLFENQTTWSGQKDPKSTFVSYAKDLQLDMAQFEKDFADSSLDTFVNQSYAEGTRLGVRATPSFFLNGEKIPNPRSIEDFKTLLDAALVTSNK